MIAYDIPLGRDVRAGLGVGYARTAIERKGSDDTGTDFDSYLTTAYVGFEPGPWFLQGSLSFGLNDYSSSRRIFFPGVDRTAEGEYRGRDYTGFITAGYHFFEGGYTITPLASLQYTRMALDGYTETGAGDVNLVVQDRDYNYLESGLGVELARPFGYRGKTLVPEVHAKWLHLLNNPELKNTAAFTAPGSPSFTTPGLKTADESYNVGAGVRLLSCGCGADKWSVEAVYDYRFRSDGYDAHEALVKFASRF